MSKTTLYKKTRTGKIQQWVIWVEKKGNSGFPEVWVEFGQTDGKKQTTNDIIKEGVNIGKSNETTPLEQANFTVERKCIKQKKEGYRDTIKQAQEQKTAISFTERFPKELCFYKPKNSIESKKITKLEKAKRLMLSVKEDGQMYIVRKSKTFGVEIYSRRMELETDKFPHLVSAFENLSDGTILLGEMILTGYSSHIKAFKAVSRICRSDTKKALRLQKELGQTYYRIFDLAFYKHENYLTSVDYNDRRMTAELVALTCDSKYIKTVEVLDMTHAEAMKYVKDNNLEGLVLWDPKGIMEDGAAFTFNGKAYRPNVVWKSKPKYEDDFIVRFDPENGIGKYGTGKNNIKIKSLFIYQLEDGEEVYLGKCGGALSDELRDFYTTAEYPRVWRIEYDAIQPETGALRYPEFNLDRTTIGDKNIEECIMSETIKQAREEENEDE